MAAIGIFNELEVVKTVDFGVYLDGGRHGEILLPSRYVPADCKPGDIVNVFIYLDSEDRLVATTEQPKVLVGEFGLLKVVGVTAIGAFLDWGLPKDLFVPFREQHSKMEAGKSYLVYVYLDNESQRLVATSKLDRGLDNVPVDYETGEEVDLIIAGQTDMGFKAIVDNSHWGMLYKNEVFKPLKTGDKLKGFIKQVRPDEKIDLCLERPGHEKIDTLSNTILDKLRAAGGFLPFNDFTDPAVIAREFGISKKNFKKSIGTLYKKRLITIETDGIKIAVRK